MGISHAFVNANGLRLHHVDFGGSGTPIVLGHGVTGHAWVWSGVADRLVEVGRVVSLDYRGFGDSQWSAEQAYTTGDHLADLEAVIGSLGASEVDLVGSSWGGAGLARLRRPSSRRRPPAGARRRGSVLDAGGG
jgi:pimeloyl-ACP methyl ester carboxylesterase